MAEQREIKAERERFGEGRRDTRWRENMAWVDFNRWSKSTTPVKAQHLRISRRCLSLRTTEGLDVNQAFGWCSTFLDYFWLINIPSNDTIMKLFFQRLPDVRFRPSSTTSPTSCSTSTRPSPRGRTWTPKWPPSWLRSWTPMPTPSWCQYHKTFLPSSLTKRPNSLERLSQAFSFSSNACEYSQEHTLVGSPDSGLMCESCRL